MLSYVSLIATQYPGFWFNRLLKIFEHEENLDAQGIPRYRSLCGDIYDNGMAFPDQSLILICDHIYAKFPSTLKSVKSRRASEPYETPIIDQYFPGMLLVHEIMHASTNFASKQSFYLILISLFLTEQILH